MHNLLKYSSLLIAVTISALSASATVIPYEITFQQTGFFIGGGSGSMLFDDVQDGTEMLNAGQTSELAGRYDFSGVSGRSVWGDWISAYFLYAPVSGYALWRCEVEGPGASVGVALIGTQLSPGLGPVAALEGTLDAGVQRGLITWTRPSARVPEPAFTLALLGLGLVSLKYGRRFFW